MDRKDNRIILLNGDVELGDWKYRRSPDYLTINWMVTETCNFNCPYCIGSKDSSGDLLNNDPIDVINSFEKLKLNTGKKIMLSMTGGEPMLARGIVTISRELTNRGFMIDLLTNACAPKTEDWIDNVNPEGIAQVSMAYHYWKLDKDERLYEKYMSNFWRAWDRGISVVLKIVAVPEIIPDLESKIEKLRKDLPQGAMVLIQSYIRGSEYPRAYNGHTRKTLLKIMECRKNTNLAFWDATGFKGMKCEAGNNLIFMNTNGDVYKCFGTRSSGSLGNIMKNNVKLTGKLLSCPNDTCGCTQHALWYGKDPWNYIKGQKFKDASYNRFGPCGDSK